MSEERLTQLREQLFQLERRIRPLEWDAGRNQINEFKKQQLEKLKTEFNTLRQELQGLESPPQ
jgi:TolA-binding protein